MNEILVQMFVCIFFLLCFLKIQRYLYDFMRKQRARRLSANGTHQDQVPPVPVDNEPTPPPMSGEEYSLYILGRINHANGLLGEAEQYYRMALKLNPASLRARIGLANIFAEQGRYDKAVAIVINCRRNDVTPQNVYELLGNGLREDEHFAAAIGVFNLGIARGVDCYNLHVSLGIACLAGRHYAEAFQAARVAIERSTNAGQRGECLSFMALCASHLEEFHTSEVCARSALTLMPDDYDCSMFLGEALVHLDRLAEALEIYRRLARLNPNCASPFLCAGQLLADNGNTGEALKYLKQALWLNPDDELTRDALADLYESLRDEVNDRKFREMTGPSGEGWAAAEVDIVDSGTDIDGSSDSPLA